jgi:hypothetical protein
VQSVRNLSVLYSEYQTMEKRQKKRKPFLIPTTLPPKMRHFVESVPGSQDRQLNTHYSYSFTQKQIITTLSRKMWSFVEKLPGTAIAITPVAKKPRSPVC